MSLLGTAFGVAALVAACSTDPVAPSPDLARHDGVLPSPARVKLLQRTPPLKALERASLTITPTRGGTLSLPNSGLTVTVPVGAISTGALTITVTAQAGKSVAYDFSPDGTVFRKALTVTQTLEKTSWKQMGSGTIWGGYYKGAVDDANGLATITESFPIRITTDGKKTTTFASFDIWHFSGYIVSSGRADGQANATLGM